MNTPSPKMTNDLVSRSSQSWSRYMTLKGLTEHIGTYSSRFHLYIAKEDLDNAADYLENNYMNANDDRAIGVSVAETEDYLIFSVRNTNTGNKPTAFQTNLSDIINYDYFTSTKKNKFRIGRGAIGDATKPKLSIPYALLYEDGHNFDVMNAPLTISYNNQVSQISLDTSKFITNKLEAIIKTEPRPLDEKPNTEVRIIIPKSKLEYTAIDDLKQYCLHYSIFSTHIRFYFDFNGDTFNISSNSSVASNTWTNDITAWAYTKNEFLIYIENLVNQYITVETALTGFRELKWLPKQWKQKKLNEMSQTEKAELLTQLKDHSSPMKTLSIPFGGNKENEELRKEALYNRISKIYDVKPIFAAHYKLVHDRYISEDSRIDFPYVFEVIAVPFTDINNSYPTYLGAVNNSVSIIDSGKSLYEGYYTFHKKGKECRGHSLTGILDHWYGYRVRESSRSHPCVVAINLLTPKVNWRDQGKSTLVIDPFANTVAETISKVMSKIPTFHGFGKGKTIDIEPERQTPAIEYLRDFLRARCTAVEADPTLKVKDRLTQSGVFYRVRRIMISEGFEPPKDWGTTRGTITNSIRDECKALWKNENITREQLGIIASARAVMIYQGQSYPVDIDSIKKQTVCPFMTARDT